MADGAETTRPGIVFDLRWYQAELINQRQRFSVWVLHRRAGKTTLAIHTLLRDVLTSPLSRPFGAYIAPLYRQAKTVAWEILKDACRDIPGTKFNESELRADLPHGRIQLHGADNADSLRGLRLDSVVLDEYAQFSPAAWSAVIRPALADRQGSAIFIGTPWGRGNHFFQLFQMAQTAPGWSAGYMPVNYTRALPEHELIALKREMTDEEYAQELECSWSAAIRGAYYGKVMAQIEAAGQIGEVPWDQGLPVWTSWDLGMNDQTVVAYWQSSGSQVRCIDHDAYQGTGLPDIVRAMRQKPYSWYAGHIFPHDIKVRELGSGVSRLETMRKLGVQPAHIARNVSVQDGISAARSMLSRTWFDKDKCGRLIEALFNYRTDFDEKSQVHKLSPLHDWSSHYADCVRYYALTNGSGQVSRWDSQGDESTLIRAAI